MEKHRKIAEKYDSFLPVLRFQQVHTFLVDRHSPLLYNGEKQKGGDHVLLWAKTMKDLNFDRLMQVYAEGNRENAQAFYPHMEPEKGQLCAEQDFWNYLTEDFFRQKGACYAIWEENGEYMAALRLEPWEDGLLLEALETHPDHRLQGHAKHLISELQQALPEATIYSHVSKRNRASLATHKACGFQILKDTVRLLDGTVSANSYTLRWSK